MCVLHLIDNGVTVGNEAGKIYIKYQSETKDVPIETIDGINVYGKPQLTTQCVEECMRRGIPISFFSSTGGYIGGFSGTNYVNVKRQRIQATFNLSDTSFELAKKIIGAKISNQISILRRFNRNYTSSEVILAEEETDKCGIQSNINNMLRYKKHIDSCETIPQLMGYEGISAREYFDGLGMLVNFEYSFDHRSKCPAKDPFNSMLSFGYSLLYKELYGIIVSKGLSPYLGFIHEDHEGHPALVSDMIEEWRAVIIDSMVMSLVNGKEMSLVDDFEGIQSEYPYYLTNTGRKKVLDKYNKKMDTTTSYIAGASKMSYRRALEYQVSSMIHAIEENDASRYNPIVIR